MRAANLARCAGLILAEISSAAAVADVTITQQTTMDVGAMIKTHGSSSTVYTDDKKRHDSETHCEGFMSVVCGNVQGGEIVRLDRGLTWQLEPKQKRYREQPFATPEQIAAAKAEMNARLEKLKSCPSTQKQEIIDKSKCKMSPPKFDVKKTGDKAVIAGFNTERTLGTITESCTNQETGDVCDTVFAIDSWLSQESVPGVKERRAFELAYVKKLGIDEMMQGMFQGQMAAYLARYQTQLSDLGERAKQFKGEPLKTTFRVLAGGPHCSSRQQQDSAADSGSGSDAGKAVGKLMGSLFKRKKDDAQPDSGSATAQTSTANDFPQMSQLVMFSFETTAIKTDPVAPSVFEVPADWSKEPPREAKAGKDDFQCPKGGT